MLLIEVFQTICHYYLNTGTPAFTGIAKPFKMELNGFYHEDFYDRVVEIWNKPVRGQNSVQR